MDECDVVHINRRHALNYAFLRFDILMKLYFINKMHVYITFTGIMSSI